jgi:hypothetical protein
MARKEQAAVPDTARLSPLEWPRDCAAAKTWKNMSDPQI